MTRRKYHRSFLRLFATFCVLSLFSSFYVFYGNIHIINDISSSVHHDNHVTANYFKEQANLLQTTDKKQHENSRVLARNNELQPKDKRRILQQYFERKSAEQDTKVSEENKRQHEVYFGCKDIRSTQIFDEVGHGYTKSVQKGLIKGTFYAVKSVLERSKDFQHCLTSGANFSRDHCFNLVKYKLAKEIILLQQLTHQNIIKLVGFCWQNEVNSNDIKHRGLSMVTELGEPLKVLALLQMPWQERLRICLGIARLISYLKNSPIGSLIIRDFRHHQFVLVNGEIKLTDLDDVDNEERACMSSEQCIVGSQSLNWTLTCVSGRCENFNAIFNLLNVYRYFIQHILVPESPQRLRVQLQDIVTKTQYLMITSEKLVEMLQAVVERLKNGDHVIFEPISVHNYEMIPEADFPGLHDYNCGDSRTQMACEVNVHSLHEAKYLCSRDKSCLAFVVTKVKTWVGFTIIYLKNNVTGMRYNKNTSVFLKVVQ